MPAQKKVDKWKLKKWFSVHAPSVFNNVIIGEIPANDENSALGRNITVALDTITHNPQHAYTNVIFKTVEVTGTTANTRLVEIFELYSYVRSLVRRYRSIAASVLPAASKDGTQMVVKLLAVTSQRTTHSRILGIRKEMNSFVAEYCKNNDFAAIVKAIVEGSFQNEIANKVEHITPLFKIEVRKLEIKIPTENPNPAEDKAKKPESA
jgi:small subunit ribosomal protein S3Ae